MFGGGPDPRLGEGSDPRFWGVQGIRFGGSNPRFGGLGPQCECMGGFRPPRPSLAAQPLGCPRAGESRTSTQHGPRSPILARAHTEAPALRSQPQGWELMGSGLSPSSSL